MATQTSELDVQSIFNDPNRRSVRIGPDIIAIIGKREGRWYVDRLKTGRREDNTGIYAPPEAGSPQTESFDTALEAAGSARLYWNGVLGR